MRIVANLFGILGGLGMIFWAVRGLRMSHRPEFVRDYPQYDGVDGRKMLRRQQMVLWLYMMVGLFILLSTIFERYFSAWIIRLLS